MTYTTKQLEQMIAAATPGDLIFLHLGTQRDRANRRDFCYIRTECQCGDDTAIATVHNGDNGVDAMIANAVLFTSAPTITAELIAARRKLEAAQGLVDALERCIASIEHADMSDGVCCCGDDMETHSNPMDCGHTPVDAGEYFSRSATEHARAAISAWDATP